jgi:hypothetical protein
MEDSPNKLDSIWRNPDGTFKKGHPPTSEGRPAGKTLKEYARNFLMSLPEEEKTKFLSVLDPKIVWQMSEGLPQQDITSGGEKLIPTPILPNIVSNETGNKEQNKPIQKGDNPVEQEQKVILPILEQRQEPPQS